MDNIEQPLELDAEQWGVVIELPDDVHIDYILDDELICITKDCKEHV